MPRPEFTFYFGNDVKYELAKKLIDQITKDYPKAKIRIIFR